MLLTPPRASRQMSAGVTAEVQVLLAARHRVDDKLGSVLEDQDDGFKKACCDVEPEP
jgi:hypothetical protein